MILFIQVNMNVTERLSIKDSLSCGQSLDDLKRKNVAAFKSLTNNFTPRENVFIIKNKLEIVLNLWYNIYVR